MTAEIFVEGQSIDSYEYELLRKFVDDLQKLKKEEVNPDIDRLFPFLSILKRNLKLGRNPFFGLVPKK